MLTGLHHVHKLTGVARDLAVFRSLYLARFMTREQLLRIHFPNARASGRKRIQKYIVDRHVVDMPRGAFEPNLLRLGARGADAVAEEMSDLVRAMSGRPLTRKTMERRASISKLTLPHELCVMDVACTLLEAMRGAEERDYELHYFHTWPALYSFEGVRRVVRPDAFMKASFPVSAEEVDSKYFFVEVDRGNKLHEVEVEKIGEYRSYVKSPDFGRRVGSERVIPGFRVLYVVQGSEVGTASARERRNNLAHAFHQAGVRSLVWLSTLEELKRDALGDIWLTPQAYAEALQGSRWDPMRRDWSPRHRDVARDELVAGQGCLASPFSP
jgi:hypothetical protein